MIEGYMKWRYHGGLTLPEAVKGATEEYRDEMDVLNDFIEECCEVGANKTVLTSDLYRTYKEWCERNEEVLLSKKAFSLRLQEKGFKDKKFTHGRRGWVGIGLKDGG
jgi:putative DNA primase/helicase